MALINTELDALSNSRVSVLRVEGPLLRSKLAWKFASFRMSLIYRTCDLAEAVIREWSDDNGLSAIILSRALMETVAMTHWFAERTKSALASGDTAGLDKLVMKSIFGVRNPDYLKDDWAAFEATSVLTMIDTTDKAIEGFRGHYDRLSDMAHPNSFGHHQFYSTLDQELIELSFSRSKRSRADLLTSIVAALYGASWARRQLEAIHELEEQIADLQEASSK